MRKVLVALAALVGGVWAWAQLPVVAVAPFAVRAGLIGADFGLAEMLEGKLGSAGFPVIPARALDSWRLGQGILVRDESAWKAAAQNLGAQYLLLGTLEYLHTVRFSLGFGPFAIQAVSAEAFLSLRLLDLEKSVIQAELSAKGQGQGRATLAFELFLAVPWDVCAGGFRTNKSVYYQAEPVVLGYLDPDPNTPPNDFYVVIHPDSSPTPNWSSSGASSSPTDPCVTWTWDQRFPPLAAPGTYVAELYTTAGSLIATTTFDIEPAFSGWSLELTFGAPEFAQTPWSQAITEAVDSLWAQLLPILRPQEQAP